MKHKKFEEWLQLSLYNELSEQERLLLGGHLAVCEQCRHDLDELKKLHGTLSHYRSIEVREPLLQDARRNLRLHIHAESIHQSLWIKVKEVVDGMFTTPTQVVLRTVALIAIGILAGYFIFRTPLERSLLLQQASTTSSAIQAGESRVANIRFLERDAQTGNVEFTFETLTPVHIRGNVNDEQVQLILARALVGDQNVGMRLRAVNMIGTQAEQEHSENRELGTEVKSALITALLHDRNLGVRREALSVLRNYLPDSVIVRAFLAVLANEKNTGLKIAAINSLDLSRYQNQPVNLEILEMMKRKAQSDDNNYIRIKAKTALQEVQQ